MRPCLEPPFVRVTDGRGRAWSPGAKAVFPEGGRVRIETDRYTAEVGAEGYIAGVAAGTFRDKATGAHDLGFGLCVPDFLLEPATPGAPVPPGQYDYNNAVHGAIPKRYVEGPQICTQAKRLPVRVGIGPDFAAVRMAYRWNVAHPPHAKAGSVWEQTLVFPRGERFFLAADRVTTVAESPALFLRVDMPGHIKHRNDQGFEHVYLSYQDPPVIPSTEFAHDFPPDARFLYRRGDAPAPRRFIRAYQASEKTPWLAGMTLNADDVYQAWCHQRGYVCLIEEVGGRAVRPGDTFGAAYVVGWFDGPDDMARVYDRFRGASGLTLDGPDDRPTGFRAVKASELTAVPDPPSAA